MTVFIEISTTDLFQINLDIQESVCNSQNFLRRLKDKVIEETNRMEYEAEEFSTIISEMGLPDKKDPEKNPDLFEGNVVYKLAETAKGK